MKKNGFTLIELLAVIIILAVVALIATPIVLNVVDDARKSAAFSETSMIVSGIQNNCAVKEMQNQLEPDSAEPCQDVLTPAQVKEVISLGNAEMTENVTLANGKVTSIKVYSNGHNLTMDSNGEITITSE